MPSTTCDARRLDALRRRPSSAGSSSSSSPIEQPPPASAKAQSAPARARPHASLTGRSRLKTVRPGRERQRDPAVHPLGELLRDREPEPRPAGAVGREEALERVAARALLEPRARCRPPSIRTRPFSRAALISTSVPGGVCRSALSSRMRMIWATRSGSQTASTRPASISSASFEPCASSAGTNSRATEPASSPRSTCSVDEVERARVEPREVEQVGGELLQPLDLLGDRLEELRARVRVELLVPQQLDEAAEREDRRAQLVRGVRDELAPRAVDALELALHLVERARQLAELVLGVDRQRRDEPAGAPPPRRRARAAARGARAGPRPGSRRAAPRSSATAPATRTRRRISVDRLGDVLEAARVDGDPRPQARERPGDLRRVVAAEVRCHRGPACASRTPRRRSRPAAPRAASPGSRRSE